MMADLLIIDTCNNYSIRNDKKRRQVYINDENSLAYLKEYDSGTQGTKISFRIKMGLLGSDTELFNITRTEIKKNFIRQSTGLQHFQSETLLLFRKIAAKTKRYSTLTFGDKQKKCLSREKSNHLRTCLPKYD